MSIWVVRVIRNLTKLAEMPPAQPEKSAKSAQKLQSAPQNADRVRWRAEDSREETRE
jgi:hypothetical protein